MNEALAERLASMVYSYVENCGESGTELELSYEGVARAMGLDRYEVEVVCALIAADLEM